MLHPLPFQKMQNQFGMHTEADVQKLVFLLLDAFAPGWDAGAEAQGVVAGVGLQRPHHAVGVNDGAAALAGEAGGMRFL